MILLGPSLPEEGYEEAPVIIDGKTTEAIGGRKLPSKLHSLQCRS